MSRLTRIVAGLDEAVGALVEIDEALGDANQWSAQIDLAQATVRVLRCRKQLTALEEEVREARKQLNGGKEAV